MVTIQAIESNWEQIYVYQRQAAEVPNYPQIERYNPIPEWESATFVSSPVVAINATSDTALDHWKFAGQAVQKIRTGLAVGGQADSVNSVKRFYLNQTSLLWFPTPTGEYQLGFRCPYWIRSINLLGWVYTGPLIKDYDSILAEIKGLVSP